MSKNKKKRNKRYQGDDAKISNATSSQPVVHRYQAVERSAAGEWWHSHKKVIKPTAIITAAVGIISWLLFELIRLVF